MGRTVHSVLTAKCQLLQIGSKSTQVNTCIHTVHAYTQCICVHAPATCPCTFLMPMWYSIHTCTFMSGWEDSCYCSCCSHIMLHMHRSMCQSLTSCPFLVLWLLLMCLCTHHFVSRNPQSTFCVRCASWVDAQHALWCAVLIGCSAHLDSRQQILLQ